MEHVPSLHTLPPMRYIIDHYGLRAEKSLGQNFLFDLNVTDKIVRAAGSLDEFPVMEVGPGPGALTRSILYANPKVLYAVEKDTRCLAALEDYLLPCAPSTLHLCEADALQFNDYQTFGHKVKIIANLPYNIATPLLIKWLKSADHVHSMVLMFQKEVVDRIVAKPGSKAYGRLSILSQFVCEVEKVFDLPPTVFYPPPKVHSAVVRLVVRKQPVSSIPIAKLEQVTQQAFSMRRKTLRSSLKKYSTSVEEACEAAGVSPGDRPESLSVQQFCTLCEHL